MGVACRWQLPNAENSFVASTANDSRQDKYAPVNPEKLKAAAAGFSQSRYQHYFVKNYYNVFDLKRFSSKTF